MWVTISVIIIMDGDIARYIVTDSKPTPYIAIEKLPIPAPWTSFSALDYFKVTGTYVT